MTDVVISSDPWNQQMEAEGLKKAARYQEKKWLNAAAWAREKATMYEEKAAMYGGKALEHKRTVELLKGVDAS